jgi:succinate-semialdehyde dehydrogenase/glutarate-semialdehyde dehydrogenase
MDSINPATGELVRTYAGHTASDVEARLARSVEAGAAWERTALEERAAPLERAAELLEERSAALAELMAVEMGKPLDQGAAEVGKCAWVCRHYAEHAAAYLAPEEIATEAARSYVTYVPLGTVLAIMPWNFPCWQVFRFAAPTLMAGNACLLKHAPSVTGTALAIEELFLEAGLPAGLFATLVVDVDRVPALIDDARVAAVTLTGSTRAGRAVAARAGAALKKVVLELGGSDPYVVLADADLDQAVTACATSRLANAGQSCIAAKRLIVVDEVRAEFTERVLERFRDVRLGDPLDPATTMGPLARVDLRDELHRQVTESVAGGAKLLLGGTRPDGPGAFYPPTVLSDVGPGQPAWSEELFGPVASILPAEGEAQALRIARDTSYGLGAAVFTRDAEHGRCLAETELRAGSCFVNTLVKSDPRLPFGGIKDSGYGRELALLGIREFVNAKTVVVA